MIWRRARSSAQISGSCGASETACHDARRARLRLHDRDAFGDDAVGVDRLEGKLQFARFDLGEIEKIVDEAQNQRAGVADIFEIILVAGVADGAEALLDDDLGEAENGVERGADLMADFGQKIGFLGARALGLLARRLEIALDRFPVGHVAQKGAVARFIIDAGAGADAPERHEQRDRSALAREAQNLAPVVEEALDAI